MKRKSLHHATKAIDQNETCNFIEFVLRVFATTTYLLPDSYTPFGIFQD